MISLKLILIVAGVVFGIIFLIAGFILTYLYAKRKAVNNPNNGLIMIDNGGQVPAIKAKLVEKTDKGFKYNYEFNGQKQSIIWPLKYTPRFNNHRLLVFSDSIGQVIASPFKDDKRLTRSEKSDLIYNMFESNIGNGIVSAIKGKSKPFSIIIIAIIAFIIGAIAVYGITQYMKMNEQKQAEKPSITQPVNPPIEVK